MPPAPPLVKPKGNKVKGPANKLRKHVKVDIRLYADFDQSGSISETDENYNKRQTFPGAILFFACLPSQKPLDTFLIQGEEASIVDQGHLDHSTRIKIVHNKGLAAGDEVFLSATRAEADKIRVYKDFAVGANAVLGKGLAAEAKIALPTGAGASLELAVCSVVPLSKAKEHVFLHLKVKRAGKEVFKDKYLFSLAPWLMPHTLSDVEEVYVAKVGFNGSFRTALRAALSPVGVPLFELEPKNSAGAVVPNGDQWMQDVFELGYQTRKNFPFSTATNSANSESRSGHPGIWEAFLDRGHAMVRTRDQTGGSLDSFGNMEVTPPLLKFPLGRKYFGVRDTKISDGHLSGGDIRPEVVKFASVDPYQPETKIPTNWLRVGHVDEFLSIVPVKDTPGDFRVLFASPGQAQFLCEEMKKTGLGSVKICDGKPDDVDPFTGEVTEFEISVDDFLTNRGGILSLNKAIEKLIVDTIIRGKLVKEWGIPRTKFLALPVIFNGKQVGKKLESCIARTAGIVNCLVLGSNPAKLIMPKPFGPKNSAGDDEFERDARDVVLKATGLAVDFIDDWDPYHVLQGEVHCGTNVKRFPPPELQEWWKQGLTINGKKVNS